jgi:hypothetical protein
MTSSIDGIVSRVHYRRAHFPYWVEKRTGGVRLPQETSRVGLGVSPRVPIARYLLCSLEELLFSKHAART